MLPLRPVIELTFDPVVTLGDWHVRLSTLALAGVILVTLLVVARIAGRTPVDLRHPPGAINPEGEANHLRRDDLLYLAVATLPGAVIFGRLGYALIHVDYYAANPGALVDISQGGFQLSLAVVGGTLTAAIVASLLDAPIPRWLHAVALPLLFALAGGKLAMALGGDGQGVPWDGAWATAYLGPGPWLSLAPEVPSHPAQVYEALATVGVLVVVGALVASGAFRGRGGAAFLAALGAWAAARAIVALTWRDPAVLGPLRMDQVISLAIAVVSLVLLGAGVLRGRAGAARRDAAALPRADEPEWPDPASRPPI